jgi:hypothetical protein
MAQTRFLVHSPDTPNTSSINRRTLTNFYHMDNELIIEYFIEDSISAQPHPIVLSAHQLLAPDTTWIISEVIDSLEYPAHILLWN